ASGQAQELFAGLAGEPAGKGQRGLAGLSLELGAVEGADDGVRVPRRRIGVDDEARLCPSPSGFLEFEGPAAVVGEGGSAEEFRVVRRRLVREEDNDLPLHVYVPVIIPSELRRGDAVADEDRLGVELLEFLLRLARAGEALLPRDVERGC